MKLTIVISKADDLFIGSIKEIPGVLTQGHTIEETRENVIDALQLYSEAMQQEKVLPQLFCKRNSPLPDVGKTQQISTAPGHT